MKSHAFRFMKNLAQPSAWVSLAVVAAVLTLWGCPNPNSIGVQQFGSVKATCVQASNGQPVPGAIVTVDGVTAQHTTDSSGTVTIDNIAIGTHPITAHAAGLDGSDTVTVIENQTVPKQVLMSPS
jgi:Carboxypeptidase regulatory-like domain